ncbi:hypothetical protein KBA41_00640 [Candidatus Ozemobacteraceae bacterium]|nr:hypothetical protein [Candidatus Ozemobacteraceae bacterium]
MKRIGPRKARILVGTGIFWFMVLVLGVEVRFRLAEVAARLAVPGVDLPASGFFLPERPHPAVVPKMKEAEQKKVWREWQKNVPVPGPEHAGAIVENFFGPDAARPAVRK